MLTLLPDAFSFAFSCTPPVPIPLRKNFPSFVSYHWLLTLTAPCCFLSQVLSRLFLLFHSPHCGSNTIINCHSADPKRTIQALLPPAPVSCWPGSPICVIVCFWSCIREGIPGHYTQKYFNMVTDLYVKVAMPVSLKLIVMSSDK